MDLRDQVQALDTSASELSKAASIRDKVKHADRIYEILAECEKLVEKFVVSEIGSVNGHQRERATKPVRRMGRRPKAEQKFGDMSLAQIGRVLLKAHATLHGSEIEKLAKAGGFKSKAEHFQSYLAVAFKRDGGFLNTGQNNWKLKEEAA